MKKVALSFAVLLAVIIVLVPVKIDGPPGGEKAVQPPATVALEKKQQLANEKSKAAQPIEESLSQLSDKVYPTELTDAIRGSDDYGDLLLRALLRFPTIDVGEQEDLLLRAYSSQPEHLLLNYHMLEFCVENSNSTVCSLPFVETLLRSNGDSQDLLIAVAGYLYAAGDVEAAYRLIVKAGTTDNAEIYLRHLEAFDESRRRHGIPRNLATLAEIIGLAAGVGLPYYSRLLEICGEQSDSGSQKWRRACSSLSENLATNGKTILDQRIGVEIRPRYSDLPERELAAIKQRADDKFDAFIESQAEFGSHVEESGKMQALIPDNIWQRYLDVYREEGEIAASLLLSEFLMGEEQ